ncbi:MBL fold metallo-hydrolase [Hamadaea tsunoensis]|uniref:MBL fold metallo-hydrolase n=1 Tax=Hamadaea tsunoensis TaxID=53368 RepID=UPI00040AA992|nr:MBL fold metallo-hydrolase [Hamadaea tsunoensis]
MTVLPPGRSAIYQVLVVGYTSATGPGAPHAGTQATVSYLRDTSPEGVRHIVIDPGMVESRSLILDPLAELGLTADDITDVVLSHHHPDNIMNAGLFAKAWVHDHKASYRDQEWVDREVEDLHISDSIRFVKTPGHSPQDITVLAGTPDGVVAFVGDLWWWPDGPVEDPIADNALLSQSRKALLELGPDVIVPGHGPAFTPDETTPA